MKIVFLSLFLLFAMGTSATDYSKCSYVGAPEVIQMNRINVYNCVTEICFSKIQCEDEKTGHTYFTQISCEARNGLCPSFEMCAKDMSIFFSSVKAKSENKIFQEDRSGGASSVRK